MADTHSDIIVRCTAAQARFLELPHPKLFAGGVGAGKTTAGIVQALQMPPNTRGCVVAPTYTMLRDVIAQAFMLLARAAIVHYDRAHQELVLKGNRVVLLRSATHPDRLRGLNLDWVWIDEATYVSEAAYNIAMGRLRRNPHLWWLTCTPRRPSWVYDRIVADDRIAVAMIRAATSSNPYLPPEFVASLGTLYSSRMARRELAAEWIELGGAVFDASWIKVADGLQYDPGAYRVLGIDLAAGTGDTADYTAMVVVTAAPTGKLQVDTAVRGRWSFGEQLERAEQLITLYHVRAVVVESNAYQIVFAQELAKRGYRVLPHHARAPKHDRITTLAPLYEMGLIQHARRLPELEAELVGYPETEHDDLLDALVYAVYGARQATDATTLPHRMRVNKREVPL